jgi:hypothetical protein
MKLTQHILSINNRIPNLPPAQIRDLLFNLGVTPSLNQVQRAMKTLNLKAAKTTTVFTCPTCPANQADKTTHDQAYHDDLINALQTLKSMIRGGPITAATN